MRRAALLPLAFCFASVPASAAEVELAATVSGGKTEWRTDAAVSGALEAGIVFAEGRFAVLALGRLGYASVDERLTTLVSLGGRYWFRAPKEPLRPFVRLSLVHQHEESVTVINSDPFGALFGIGDAIRHRGGFEGALGADYALGTVGSLPVDLAGELSTTWFYDDRGPHWLVGASVGLRVRFPI